MAVSLKNMAVQADALRAKLKAEQDAKEQKAAPKADFNDSKFKGELIGAKTTYILRILPNTHLNDGNSEPWAQTAVHIFTNPMGVKKFALCPKTLDKAAPCPLCEKSRALFAKVNAKEASKAEEDAARRFYHKPRYFVNVLVVDDPRPADKGCQKGKVLVWELGPQIKERLSEALIDQKKTFHDVQAGFNFHLVVKKKGEFLNYEASYFSPEPTPVATDDAELERISNSIVDLQKFAIGRGPRPYEDLKAMMEGREIEKKEREYDSATGETTSRPVGAPALNEEINFDDKAPVPAAKAAVASAAAPAAPKAASKPALSDDELLSQLDGLESV
jgi:hypothetical protein